MTPLRSGIAVFALLPLAVQAGDTVRVIEERQRLVIEAKDGRELQQQLDALQAASRSHGRTTRSFETRFDGMPGAHGCRVVALDVTVRVTTSLPYWEPPRRTPQWLRQRWDAAIAGLDRHERGHRDNAVDAANRIHDDLAALPPAADCEALRRQAQRIVDRHLFRADMRDVAYDHRTAHGAAQGALLVLGKPPVQHDRSSAMQLRDRHRVRDGMRAPVFAPWRRGPARQPDPQPQPINRRAASARPTS